MHCLILSALIPLAFSQSFPDPQEATVFSLVYGYPLLAWQNAAAPIIENVGVNSLHHARQLRGPSDTSVVKPNVDTLYSQAAYDLSQANVELTVPELPVNQTFALFSFYDPFGDNFANVGTGGFYRPGKYLVRPYDPQGSNGMVGLQMGNGTSTQATNGSSGQYVGTVYSPTLYGTILIRWLLDSNLDQVHEWQDASEVRGLGSSNATANTNAPRLQDLMDVYNSNDSPATNVLTLLAKYAPGNGPFSDFNAAGIINGNYSAIDSVDLSAANSTAVQMIASAATNPANLQPANNGWTLLSPEYIGVYGTNYALRSLIAEAGYLALQNPYAVYPIWSNASSDSTNANAFINVGPNEAVMLTFSGRPPLQAAGFWSVTAYGSDYYLIPNNEDVYALGDRSSITYPNGNSVYGGSGSSNRNGSFQILIQPADVTPPGNWTDNWLPAPSGGGEVMAQLRFFAARRSLIDGSYEFPVVEKMSAIRRSNGGSGGGGNGGNGGGNNGGGGGNNGGGDGSGNGEGAGHASYSAARTLPWIAGLTAVVCLISGTIAL